MATFVLVHGAWTGGWIWRRVRPLLRAAGHEVFSPTLTGLGERAHLASHEIGLHTHIDDVFGLLEYEELRRVVLVGHGYGGMVITGVADRVPEWLSGLVYLDAAVPRDGEAMFDLLGKQVRRPYLRSSWATGEGWRIPIPPDYAGLTGPDARWVHSYAVGQPVETFEEPLRLHNPVPARLPHSYLRCGAGQEDEPPAESAIRSAARARTGAGWHYRELPTGHAPQVSDPKLLVAALEELA